MAAIGTSMHQLQKGEIVRAVEHTVHPHRTQNWLPQKWPHCSQWIILLLKLDTAL